MLSFLFEGQVFYSLLELHALQTPAYLLIAMIAHFAGLFSCGYLIKSRSAIGKAVTSGMVLCVAATAPFFFVPSWLWVGGLVVGGYASGCVVALFGFFFKALAPKEQRIQTCADILIYSNVIMAAINIVAVNVSPSAGLIFSLFCVVLGLLCIRILPVSEDELECRNGKKRDGNVSRPLLLLFLFILIITINSGLMYQVMNPAFDHLAKLASWYWAVPYIVALVIMRNLPQRVRRFGALYIGMIMMIAAFICFMLLGRTGPDYIIVNTLMLGACGIFDLFWWTILGEMLDYTANPVGVFGMGLSANVLGVLIGDLAGINITLVQLSSAEVAVLALTVASVTLLLLPLLNRHLVLLLRSHAYLAFYDRLSKPEQGTIYRQVPTLDPLTVREEEVLELLLDGKSNRGIGEELFISESTVKTHVRNIFSKYDVGSRAELISTLLKNRLSG